MATPNPTRLEIIIAALDRATGPLRALAARLRAFSQAAGIDKLGKAFSNVGKSVGRVVGEVGKLAALGGAAAFGLGALVNKATEAGDALGNAAMRAKFAVGAFTELQFAAGRAGLGPEEFAAGIDKFNKAIGEAKLGKGKLASFLTGVSPKLLQQIKLSKDGEDSFNVMLKVFDRVKDPRIQAALAGKVFGDAKFAQFLTQGSKAVTEMREAIRLKDDGASQRFVAGAQAMDAELDELTETVTFLGRGVMAELFPAFVKLARMFNSFLLENKEAIKAWAKVAGEKLLKFADDLPQRLKLLGEQFSALKAKLEPLAKRVGGFGNLLGIVAGLIIGGPLLAAIGSLAAAFISLGIVLATTPVGWVILGIAAAAFLVIKNWSSLKTFFTDLWADVTDLFQGFSDFVTGAFTGDMKKAWEGLKKVFGSTFDIQKAGLKSLAYTNPVTAPFFLAKSLFGREEPSGSGTAGVPANRSIGTVDPDGVPTLLRRPTLGAEAARPRGSRQQQPQNVVRTNNAAVQIEVKAPRGTKVSLPRGNTADVTLNVGYTPELAK